MRNVVSLKSYLLSYGLSFCIHLSSNLLNGNSQIYCDCPVELPNFFVIMDIAKYIGRTTHIY